jgi:hypothetical protein
VGSSGALRRFQSLSSHWSLVFGLSQAVSRDSVWAYRNANLDIPYTTRDIAVVVNVVLSAVQLLVYILARFLLIFQALELLKEQPARCIPHGLIGLNLHHIFSVYVFWG